MGCRFFKKPSSARSATRLMGPAKRNQSRLLRANCFGDKFPGSSWRSRALRRFLRDMLGTTV
eukprot:620668-Alexandrium_andersonii.AAC.1